MKTVNKPKVGSLIKRIKVPKIIGQGKKQK